MRYHFIPNKMVRTKKHTVTNAGEDVGKLEPHTLLVEIANGTAIGKQFGTALKSYNPELLFPGTYPWEIETWLHKNLCIDIHNSIIHNSRKV